MNTDHNRTTNVQTTFHIKPTTVVDQIIGAAIVTQCQVKVIMQHQVLHDASLSLTFILH